MNTSPTDLQDKTRSSRWQRIGPVILLLLLAPIISEVLSGSTRLTTMFVLLPEIGIWGGGALIIRYLARRFHKDWTSIFIMGLALALAEECVIQQTSLAPLIGVDPAHLYGRLWGVNWVYLLWALGFESIWVVVVPILLVELIFPQRKEQAWIGRRGLVITTIFFVLASFAAWYSWTQVFLPKYYPQSVYQVPPAEIGIALVVIVLLVILALAHKPAFVQPRDARAMSHVWLVGSAAFGFGLVWFLVILLPYGALPALPPLVATFAALALAAAGFALLKWWAAASGWGDPQKLALVFGVVAATLVAGAIVLAVSAALPVDRIGQLAFNLIAIGGLGVLARRPQFRPA